MLFSNNIQSPLETEGDELVLKNDRSWDLNFFNKNI